MSAAIFRRQGKIEQAKGAIQEAEVRDEDNPNIWVQVHTYYYRHHEITLTFYIARFIPFRIGRRVQGIGSLQEGVVH